MSLEYLKDLIENNLVAIRDAMRDIGVGISSGVTIDDWELYLRMVDNDPYALEKPTDIQTPVGRAQFLVESLINLRHAINDLQDDTLVTGIPLEQWPDYIRKIMFDWTGCRTYVIRLGDNLGDISVAPRRLSAGQSPDLLYSIYVENGIAKTALKTYEDESLNYGWADQHTLGDAVKVALAFDGYWERLGETLHLVTGESPFLFWADPSGNLYKQMWGDVSTKELIATNVVHVKAIRAWKNFEFPDQDLGVIVAYIKTDGKVYYRAWAEQSNGVFIWEAETELVEFTGTAVSLNLFITNDYRVGVIVANSDDTIHWFITERNWAGMALKREKITLALNASIDLNTITYHQAYNRETITMGVSLADALRGYTLTDNVFMEVYNLESEGDYGQLVEFTIKEPLVGAEVTDFILTDARSTTHYPLSLTKQTHYKYLLEFENLNNAGSLATLKFVGDATNALGVSYVEFEKDFVPVGLVPTVLYPPEVEVIWNE